MHSFFLHVPTAHVSLIVLSAAVVILSASTRYRRVASSHRGSNSSIRFFVASVFLLSVGLLSVASAIERHPLYAMGTIKPARPGSVGRTFHAKGDRFEATNISLSELISFAYGPHSNRVEAPAWVENEKFDVTAQSDGKKDPTEEQWRYMVQKLLSESFHLRCHRVRKITLRIDSSAASADVLIIDHVEKPY